MEHGALLLYYTHIFLEKWTKVFGGLFYILYFILLWLSIMSLKFNNNIILQGDLKFFIKWKKKYLEK